MIMPDGKAGGEHAERAHYFRYEHVLRLLEGGCALCCRKTKSGANETADLVGADTQQSGS